MLIRSASHDLAMGGISWARSWQEFIFQCLILFAFHTVHGVLKGRILQWFAIPFSSAPHFVRTLHSDPSDLGGPIWHAWLSFIELDKAVVHVIRLAALL